MKNVVVREWAVKVIEAVVRLRQSLKEVGHTGGDPIEALEQQVSDWRNQLPFAVADDAARTLLVALLEAPTASVEPADQLQIRTFLWVPLNGDVSIVRRLDGSDRLREEFVASLLEVLAVDLPSRFQLFLSAADGSIPVATLNRVFGENEYRATFDSNRSLSGPAATGLVMVSAAVGQSPVGNPHDLVGGSALPDVPWIFTEDDGKLLGTGRVRTTRSTVLIAIPDDWNLQTLDGNVPERLRACTELTRTIYRISGQVVAQAPDEGESFQIKTGTDADDLPSFELRGNLSLLGPAGGEVWLGPPHVYRADNPNGPWRAVANQQVEWRPWNGPRHWQPMNANCLGDVLLRVLEHGECLVRFVATVMPQAFSCRLRPDAEQDKGLIHLQGLSDTACDFTPETGLEVEERQILNGVRRFDVLDRRSQLGSRRIQLQLRFGENRSANLEISSPTRSVRIVDAGGRLVQCTGDVCLPLDVLDGLRMIAVISGAKHPCLVAEDGSEVTRLSLFRNQEEVFVVGLGGIRDEAAAWLGTRDEPGEAISFLLHRSPNEMRNQALLEVRIGEHGGKLKQEDQIDGTMRFNIPEVILDWPFVDRQQVRLEVQRLGFPERQAPSDAIKALPDQSGYWEIDPALLPDGPWLVTAWINERVCLHPRRIIGTMPDQVDLLTVSIPYETTDLFTTTLAIHNRQDRRAAWQELMNELVNNSHHSSWESVNSLMEACRSQPVTTFEAVNAITQDPRAIARWALMYLNSQSRVLWERLERLPFLWGLVPVRIWADAFRSQKLLYPMESIWKMRQNDFLQYATPCSSALEVVTSCLSASHLLPSNEARVTPLMPNQRGYHVNEIQRLRNQLVDRHDIPELQWPGERFELPSEVFRELPQFGLDPNNVYGWQRAVCTAPIYCAWRLVHAVDFPERDVVVRLQQLRAFDREWFSRCRRHAAFYFASQRFQQDNNWLD